MISQLAGSRIKKKKRKQTSGKLLNISESVRNKVLIDHMKNARTEVWEKIRKGYRLVYFKFWINDEEMKKLIIAASRSKKRHL